MATTSSTTSSTSGLLTALGLGSGLDIDSLVTELTTAEMLPANNRVERQQESVTVQVSAMATLKSALSTFQSTLDSLASGSGFDSHTATSSDEDLLTATADADAVAGTYRVVVQQLAQAQQLVSNSFSGGSTAEVGTGTLTLSLGEDSFSIDIDSSNSTLAEIRDAINSASDNPGISATLIYGSDGAQLVLSSETTGAASTITVTASGGDGGLEDLEYDADTTTNYTEEQEAQDAIITIAGVEHTSSSNSVDDAIDGVTLSLESADPDTTISLKIGNDKDHVVSMVESFVSAYNTLSAQLTSLGSYDADTEEAGALLGDSLLGTIKSQLRHALSDAVSGLTGSHTSLASLGITTNEDGYLELDTDTLNSVLGSDFSTVTKIFDSSNGVMARLSSFLESQLASDGGIAVRSDSLDNQQKAIDNEQESIEQRTEQVRSRYLARFNTMDNLLAQLENTSSYLTQVFDALNKDS